MQNEKSRITNSLVNDRHGQFIDIIPEPLDTEKTTIKINHSLAGSLADV
jgi:hypothetical protein